MLLPRVNWTTRLLRAMRELGPYAAIGLILPGGSLIAFSLWALRRRSWFATSARMSSARSSSMPRAPRRPDVSGFAWWFKLLIVCLIAILPWQVSRGAEKPEFVPTVKWHLFNTLLNADTGDRFVEQEDYGSNEPADGYDSLSDCVQGTTQTLLPSQFDHIRLLVSCRTVPPSGELKPALLRRRRR